MTAKPKIAALWAGTALILLAAGLMYFRGSWSCRDGVWVPTGRPLSRHPQTACAKPKPTPPKICSPAWSCGRLAQGETGMKRDVWYLKYDDVAGPAQLEMVFNDDAKCRVDGIVADCNRLFPPSGSSSSFSGYKDGDLFRVASLDFSTKK